MNKMRELTRLFFTFFKLGAFTFGGGYAMLPMLEREIVTRYKWTTMEELMDYFAIGQCTPGVIAVNTATFIGYKRRGIVGGIVATLGVITPSVIMITLIASALSVLYNHPLAKHAFAGIGVAVCAVLTQAVIKIIKSGVCDWFTLSVAGIAFILSLFFKISTILIVILAGVAALVYKNIFRLKSSDTKGGKR